MISKTVPEVLFVCVHNAGRSQMAAALMDHLGEGRVHVRSAGSEPADQINPHVVSAMSEIGLDVSKEFPKPMTDEVVRAADVVITMSRRTRGRGLRASAPDREFIHTHWQIGYLFWPERKETP